MKKITKKELKPILEQHKLWLDSNETEGKRVDLSGANLRGANLRCADLSGADLTGADLTGADLIWADLSDVDLSGADLSGADLTGADLTGANLTGAKLSYADLYRANLTDASLFDANLTGANLTGANLTSANLTFADLYRANLTGADLINSDLEYSKLTDAILDEKEQCRKGIVLTEPMTVYKKSDEGKIITLEIPVGAKLFSINNYKRRTNKVKVIDMQGEPELRSWYNTDFKYHVGDEIEITNFDENYNVECGAGIHFFLTREEAEIYES